MVDVALVFVNESITFKGHWSRNAKSLTTFIKVKMRF